MWIRTVGLLLVLAGGTAAAQPVDDGSIPTVPVPASAQRSAAVGTFAPYSMAARSDTQKGTFQVRGGYDGGRGSPVFEIDVETAVTRRLSLWSDFSYDNAGGGTPARLGLKLDVLRQETQVVDMAVAGSYALQAFNRVSAAELTVAVGRTVGGTRLSANAVYGQGLERNERYADLRAGGSRQVARRVHVGLDSRLRLDLERDADEPTGEAEWDLVAGPQGIVTLGSFALSATAGVSAIKLRDGTPTKVGALVTTGIGSAF